jgi:hypothetical protein
MLFLVCRDISGTHRPIFYRWLDRLFLLAAAGLLEVGFLGMTPGWGGLLGLVSCYLCLRLVAELILRHRLAARSVFLARLAGFALVGALLLREFFVQ